MKSVGEVMAIGRTFKESLFKGLRSLEAVKPLRLVDVPHEELQRKLARPIHKGSLTLHMHCRTAIRSTRSTD
jgi:hypothetical protein